jgi:hypothetical protein
MKNYLILILTLMALLGCKKMPLIANQPKKPIAISNAGNVTRIIRLDTDYYPNKYVYREFRYDDSNRVHRYINYEIDSGTNPGLHLAVKDTLHVITFDYPVDSVTNYPTYSLENYRSSGYILANGIHRYFYDNQNRLVLDTLISFYQDLAYSTTTSRGVVVSRRIHYNALSIIVDNINLDTYTSVKGVYRDTVLLDGGGNPASITALNGKYYVSGPFDNFKAAGFIKDNYTYGNLENPLNKMNVSNIMAFVQTGFPGGSFYASYLAKNAYSSQSTKSPGILNTLLTNFKYMLNPFKIGQITKVVFSRPGANQHGGYEIFTYDTPF